MRPFCFLSLALLFVGCSSTLYYAPPLPHSGAVSISGTRLKTALLSEDQRFFIFAIDGDQVEDARDYAEKELLVGPGPRTISCRYQQGAYSADADFVSSIKPGQKLQVKGRIVSYNSAFLASHLPEKVGFSLVDLRSGAIQAPEIIKPVSFHATTTYIPIFVGK